MGNGSWKASQNLQNMEQKMTVTLMLKPTRTDSNLVEESCEDAINMDGKKDIDMENVNLVV